MSELYTSTFKPLFDVILFSRRLARTAGAEGRISTLKLILVSSFLFSIDLNTICIVMCGHSVKCIGPSLMFLYYFLAGSGLRALAPPFGKVDYSFPVFSVFLFVSLLSLFFYILFACFFKLNLCWLLLVLLLVA